MKNIVVAKYQRLGYFNAVSVISMRYSALSMELPFLHYPNRHPRMLVSGGGYRYSHSNIELSFLYHPIVILECLYRGSIIRFQIQALWNDVMI